MGIFGDLWQTIYSQIVNIPIENNLSWVYVILNFIFTLLAPSLDSGSA